MELVQVLLYFKTFNIHAACPQPYEGDYVTRKTSFSYVLDGFFTGTKVKYTCESSHSLKWDEPEVLTCGNDGDWDFNRAPQCAPGKFRSILHLFLIFLCNLI